MNYYYYQQVGGNETWKPVPETKLDTLDGAMFRTILAVDSPVSDSADKAELDAVKYKGPFYVDLDDADSPASTAMHAVQLVGKLEDLGVFPAQLELYASGSKGFHVIVPEECFLTKPPKTGFAFLPAIFKEIAFELAVPSMDFRVYTARKGRMFRRANVLRPNGLYKVRISYDELVAISDLAKTSKDEAEAHYRTLCSTPRKPLEVEQDDPELATGLLALFDQCKSKVTKAKSKTKKQRVVHLPKELPSFEALLRGEGIKEGVGFHQIAMQVAIVAHARNMSQEDFLAAADGLCENHESDGNRYNTASKRRYELRRMWEYTEDNPCYVYSPAAITTLLNHSAPDFHGIVLTAEESENNIREAAEGEELQQVDDFGHAGVVMTRQGAFTVTENGPKMLTAVSFDNVTELVSVASNQIAAISADMYVSGKLVGTKAFELEEFASVGGLNKIIMRQGQAFSGNDVQARGVYMRIIERARKAKNRMYVVNREGLDFIQIPFHEDEEVRKGFLAWTDGKGVAVEPRIADTGLQIKFVGYPKESGSFETDLSLAPNLVQWLAEGDNKEDMRRMLQNLLHCQSPEYLSKLLGWSVACFYRMMFHDGYKQFPMLHVNGSAGAGKCFAKGTQILMADGTVKSVEDVQVGDRLLGPDGGIRNVLTLGRGRETMYKVTPTKGDSYTVNESHILSLRNRHSQKVTNLEVKKYLAASAKWRGANQGWRVPGALCKDFTPQYVKIKVEKLEAGDYYGFEIDGDHLFLLKDFTVVHNTAMCRLFANLHYYNTEVKMMSPSSTLFTVGQAAAGSASIPLILDEFKPSEMIPAIYDKFKLMLRDAYNCRSVEKGGGTRDNSDYRSVHVTQLSAPICFIAEAAESESALMERVVLLTLVKPNVIRSQQYFHKFSAAAQNARMLGILGKYMSAQIVKRYSPAEFITEFQEIYDATRKDMMLQPEDVDLSPQEFQRKSRAKERTVYNYSVAKFGLLKFTNLIHNIFGSEFDQVFIEMQDTICSSVELIQDQTTPEWMKVLNTFADMSVVDSTMPYYLKQGVDYTYVDYNGKNCIELYLRACYFKYRAYCNMSRSRPLFASENAFLHAIGNLPALVAKGVSVDLETPGGSHILDMAELRTVGFIAPGKQ